MTGYRSFLSDFVKSEEGRVKFGGKEKGTIRGYGSITDGRVVIRDVRYVEGLDHNLFNSSQLCESGYINTQFLLGCIIKDEDGNEILRGNVPGISILFISKLSLTQKEPVYSPKLRPRTAGSGTDVFPIRTSETSPS